MNGFVKLIPRKSLSLGKFKIGFNRPGYSILFARFYGYNSTSSKYFLLLKH